MRADGIVGSVPRLARSSTEIAGRPGSEGIRSVGSWVHPAGGVVPLAARAGGGAALTGTVRRRLGTSTCSSRAAAARSDRDQIEQLARHLGRRRPRVARASEQGARERLEQRIDLDQRGALPHRRDRARQVPARDIDAGALERQLAGEHLVADHAEREEIDAVIDVLPGRVLRRHVVRRPEHHALGRQALAVAGGEVPERERDPEIEDARRLLAVRAPLDEHVVRLEVAVDHAVIVRVLEAVAELPGDVRGALAHRAARPRSAR